MEFTASTSVPIYQRRGFQSSTTGTVRINKKFGTVSPHTVTVVAYAEFENIIEVDRNRNVVLDFNN